MTDFYAKLSYDKPPLPEALFRVTGHLGEYFDKRTQAWTPDGSVIGRVDDDMDIFPITPEQAVEVEARFRRG